MIGTILLAVYLIIVGVAALVGHSIPGWFTGLLACGAGVFLLLDRFVWGKSG